MILIELPLGLFIGYLGTRFIGDRVVYGKLRPTTDAEKMYCERAFRKYFDEAWENGIRNGIAIEAASRSMRLAFSENPELSMETRAEIAIAYFREEMAVQEEDDDGDDDDTEEEDDDEFWTGWR